MARKPKKKHRLESLRYLKVSNIVVSAMLKALWQEDMLTDDWHALAESDQDVLSAELTCMVAEEMIEFFDRVDN